MAGAAAKQISAAATANEVVSTPTPDCVIAGVPYEDIVAPPADDLIIACAGASETTLVGDAASVTGAAHDTAAQDGENVDESTDADESADPADADVPTELGDIKEQFEAFEACLAENGIDFEKFDGPMDHPGFGFGFGFEHFDFEEFGPEDFDPAELDKLFEEKFGDVHGESFELFDIGPDVSVMDNGELTIADFGDGDGTITITKSGDDISVASTGDVTIETVEPFSGLEDFGEGLGFDFDFHFEPGRIPKFDFEGFPKLGGLNDAFHACEELLPEDVFPMGGVFGGPFHHGTDQA